jgi:hypothetical protein
MVHRSTRLPAFFAENRGKPATGKPGTGKTGDRRGTFTFELDQSAAKPRIAIQRLVGLSTLNA